MRSKLFDTVRDFASRNVDIIVRELLPSAKKLGNEWRVGSIAGDRGASLSIDAKSGLWFDFARPDDKGDIISLWQRVHGLPSPRDAAEQIAARYSLETSDKPEEDVPITIETVPARRPDHIYVYRDCTKGEASEVHKSYLRPIPYEYIEFMSGQEAGPVGNVVFEVHRWDGPKKRIRPFNVATGRYEKPIIEGGSPLYNVVEVKTSAFLPAGTVLGNAVFRAFGVTGRLIIVVEGEKAADHLRGVLRLAAIEVLQSLPSFKGCDCEDELLAAFINDMRADRPEIDVLFSIVVTPAGGAGSASRSNWSPLAGRDVLIWPDNDESGKKYAESVLEILNKVGVARVGVLEPKREWPVGADAADEPPGWMDALVHTYAKGMSSVGLRMHSSIDVFAGALRPVEWVVDKLIPAGEVTVIAGDGGTGKSRLCRLLAACIAHGSPETNECGEQIMPVLGGRIKNGSVIYISAEDHVGSFIAELSQFGAEWAASGSARPAHELVFIEEQNGSALFCRNEALGPILRTDAYERLRSIATSMADLRLIVIDTMARAVSGLELSSNASVTEVMGALHSLARETGAAVVVIHHLSKSRDPKSAPSASNIQGASAFANFSRSAMIFSGVDIDKGSNIVINSKTGDHLNDVERVSQIFHVKSNWSKAKQGEPIASFWIDKLGRPVEVKVGIVLSNRGG